MESSTFTIEGMTCQSCVKTIKETLTRLANVVSVDVNLEKKSVAIAADRKIGLSEVTSALITSPKYKVSAITEIKQESLLKTYKPLITVFSFILLASLAYQVSTGVFNSHVFMNHLMAGFFLVFAFFKLLNIKAFANAYANYDLLANRWHGWGIIYPFIELALGLAYLTGVASTATASVTILESTCR